MYLWYCSLFCTKNEERKKKDNKLFILFLFSFFFFHHPCQGCHWVFFKHHVKYNIVFIHFVIDVLWLKPRNIITISNHSIKKKAINSHFLLFINVYGHTRLNASVPVPLTEIKQVLVWSVLGRGTTREYQMS